MSHTTKPPAPHIQAAEAAEVQRAIQFAPDFPCYFCGQATTEAIVRNFVFVPICPACAKKLHTQHGLWEQTEDAIGLKTPPTEPAQSLLNPRK